MYNITRGNKMKHLKQRRHLRRSKKGRRFVAGRRIKRITYPELRRYSPSQAEQEFWEQRMTPEKVDIRKTGFAKFNPVPLENAKFIVTTFYPQGNSRSVGFEKEGDAYKFKKYAKKHYRKVWVDNANTIKLD